MAAINVNTFKHAELDSNRGVGTSSQVVRFFGPTPLPGGQTHIGVWGPLHQKVEVVRFTSPHHPDSGGVFPLEPYQGGYWRALTPLQPGDLYKIRINGEGLYPDPASLSQPYGVHGPSQVILLEPTYLTRSWCGPELCDYIIYELHIGTFSPEGTFSGALKLLPHLHKLGVTAVQIMPVSQFGGAHGWGYDKVYPFAVHNAYGSASDLQKLCDELHSQGMAVILDVVYNHHGHCGNYSHAVYGSGFYDARHPSPWGGFGFNFAEEAVRRFFLENARYMIETFGADALRLDAAHAIQDTSPKHFLAELSEEVCSLALKAGRPIYLLAENDKNDRSLLEPSSNHGFGMDAQYLDDLHHLFFNFLTGASDAYFKDYRGTTTAALAKGLEQAWFFQPCLSANLEQSPRTDPTGLERRVVAGLNTHDQVGNVPPFKYLHHTAGLSKSLAATALLITCPKIPMIFQGEEFGCTNGFSYFTDFRGSDQALGDAVSRGRIDGFRCFSTYERQDIPDPQAQETFYDSKVRWQDLESSPHVAVRDIYARLIQIRKEHPAVDYKVASAGEGVIIARSEGRDGRFLITVANLMQQAVHVDSSRIPLIKDLRNWRFLCSTERRAGGSEPLVSLSKETVRLLFQGSGAIVFCALLKDAQEEVSLW